MDVKACKKLGGTRNPRTKKCEMFKKGWVHVDIPIKETGVNTHENINQLQWKLSGKGITFDMSIMLDEKKGLGSRDWELDWSLEGARPRTVLNYLERAGIRHRVKKVPDLILT